MAEKPKEHISWIDAYKGALSLLVVAGHVIGGGIHLMPAESFGRTVAEYAFKFIYRFHMPAFFFIAGVTFGKGRPIGFADFLRRKSRRLLVPYFLFGILSGVLYLASSGVVNASIARHATDSYYADKSGVAWWVPFVGLLHGGGWPNGQGFIANSVLWFLPCLFMVETVYFAVDKVIRNRIGQLFVAALLLLSVYPLGCVLPQMLPWGVSRLPFFLPFLILGRWMPLKIQTWRFTPVAGTILLLLLVGCVIVSPNAYYANETWCWSLLFIGLAILGTMSLLCLICVMDWRLLRICGVSSMTIMLLHKFIVVFLQIKVPFSRQLTSSGGWAMAGVSFAIVGIAVSTCIALDRLIRRFAPWMLGV